MLQTLGNKITKTVEAVAGMISYLGLSLIPHLADKFSYDELKMLVSALLLMPLVMSYQVASGVFNGTLAGFASALKQPRIVYDKWQRALLTEKNPGNRDQRLVSVKQAISTAFLLGRMHERRAARLLEPAAVQVTPVAPEAAEPVTKIKKLRRRKKKPANEGHAVENQTASLRA